MWLSHRLAVLGVATLVLELAILGAAGWVVARADQRFDRYAKRHGQPTNGVLKSAAGEEHWQGIGVSGAPATMLARFERERRWVIGSLLVLAAGVPLVAVIMAFSWARI